MAPLTWPFAATQAVPIVSPLETAHAPACAAIHAESFARPWSAVDLEGLIADRGVIADGVFLSDPIRPKGFVLARAVLDEAEILTVAIASAQRGKGLARALMLRHLDGLAVHGIARVHLEVDAHNGPALALYRRLGFVETGRREGYYPRPDGSRAAALTLTRTL